MSGSALIAVSHLLGTGHLVRTALIAALLAERGVDVTLVSGGMPVPHVRPGRARLIQLPPVRAADETFQRLIDAEGREIGPDYLERRRSILIETCRSLRPAVVAVEHYPFGRRKLAGEFQALLVEARGQGPQAVTVGSVRDVLNASSNAERVALMAERARAELDLVLVHGDPRLVPFEASFPLAPALADRLVYTGYVTHPPAPHTAGGIGEGEIVVSAGGGAVGRGLYDAALGAARHIPHVPWRILTGAARTPDRIPPPAHVIVEPNRADFRAILANCRVSVSQAGYNTVAETLAARARSVIVPFAGGGETEQAIRAGRLAALGLAQVLAENELSPATLAAAVERSLRGEGSGQHAIDLGGAERGAAILAKLVRSGHAGLARLR